jgi:putative ABC transport system ATP-binding protein
MNTLITCRDLWKIYRLGDVEVHALRGLNLTIAHGEFVAIMGASGSGKSTLMNILGCLDQPTRGSYTLNGRDVSGLSSDALAELRNKEIGFVFQNFNLIPRTSALENVQLPLFYRGMPIREQRARASEALARVGLAGREHHYPAQLSGGQQQRVAIARGLVTNPSLLLADEPTGNLDSESSHDIMGMLDSLNRQDRITVIVVTHEVDIAAFTRRTIVVKDGNIVRDAITDSKINQQRSTLSQAAE